MTDYETLLFNLEQLKRMPIHRTYRAATGASFEVSEESAFPWFVAVIVFVLLFFIEA